MKKIILASASPRRKQLLKTIVDTFEIIPSNAIETYPETLPALDVSLYLSKIKADDIHNQYPTDIVIGSDTTVIINDKVLGKPLDREDAFNMLSTLSNNVHIPFL
jgi:septum formation protein